MCGTDQSKLVTCTCTVVTSCLLCACLQVKSLIVEGEQFEKEEVLVMLEKVRQLQSMYKSVEEAGSHAFLNELRALNASLINKWEEFEKSLATHMSNLDLSLQFQETLFKVITPRISCAAWYYYGDIPLILAY